MTDFERFWQVYPKRSGKKVGKKLCRQWFATNGPFTDVVDDMIAWLSVDNGNRTSKKDFYASLPDPIRFLTRAMWEDDIEPITEQVEKTKLPIIRGKFCGYKGCGMPAVHRASGAYDTYRCLDHAPAKIREKYC